MLFTGTFVRTLDEKLRFAIPKRVRDSLSEPDDQAMYLAPGTDGSLSLYTEAAFSRLGEDLGDASPTAQDVRAFSRLFYAQAQRVEIDRQGRVRVPAELAALASLSKEIVLIGVRDHLEIWNKPRWESYFADRQTRYDEIAENAFQTPGKAGTYQNGPVAGGEARPGQPR